MRERLGSVSLLVLLLGVFLSPGLTVQGQVPPGSVPKASPGFEITRWAREPMLRSPVALSFDHLGRLYVAETARRSTVDIDIRAHPTWVVDDLANQSVEDLRRFFRSKMSTENSVANAGWLKDLNGDGLHDWQDLTQVKEKVHRLEDSQGTGKADRSTVFAEGFNEEINGVIAGVMPWGDDVFVTVYPDLWRLRDTDGDGVADQNEIVFRGFGVHAAFDGHDLHGLIAGPDGKLYFSVGDNGFSVTNREGRRWHHPNTGGVLRMNPDGSELEVFATGLRNVQEIAFDEWGNMFGVDNDGDLADERERFVFIAEGSDSGWRLHWQFREAGWARFTHQPNYNPWVDERMWVPYFPGQPAHITPPLSNYSVGPGSFRYNPGTALNEAYRGHFFLIQFPVAKVTAFRVRPKGAGFEMLDEHTFVSGMMASALSFGPDGGLYIGDWDGMWSPSGKGSVWRVDDPGVSTSAVRTEVREWLKQGPRQRAIEDLERGLGHADQRIRQASQFELVRRRAFEPLWRVVYATNGPVLARVHALWGLGQGRAQLNTRDLPLADPDSRIRAQAAKVAGDARLSGSVKPLVRLLADPDLAVRFQAALALGKIGDSSAFDALRDLLEMNADQDAFLRHAAVMGWVGMRQVDRLAALTSHRAPAVRLAAVVALRRLHSEAVAAYLQDPDEGVRREAVRAIHDDSIPGALPALAAMLETVMFRNDRATDAGPGGIPGGETPPSTAGGTPAATEAGIKGSSPLKKDLGTVRERGGIPGGETPPSAAGETPAATEAGIKGDAPRSWDVGSMRRMLHANLRVGTETSARRLARYASGERHPPELRLEALECLAQWAAEPALDRVQGFVRPLGERNRDLGGLMIGDHFGEIRRGADKPLLQALVRVVLEHRMAVDSAVFVEWCLSADQPASIRAQALELLAQKHPDRLPAVLSPCLASTESELRMAAWRVQGARDPEGFMDGAVAEFGSRTLKERQALVRLVGSVPGEKARQWMDVKLDEQVSDRLAPELVLDVLEAAALRPEQDIRDKVAAAEDRLRSAPPWRSYRVALAGGDAERGREVFRSHPNGQCVRCHEAGGEGQQVGPVLKGIAGRVNREYLLESLIDPSARIADGFATVSLETRDGEVWDGIRTAENEQEITLRLGTGVVQTIRRSDIARQTSSNVSAMPPMGEVLSRAEIRDLLEYLMTQK